MPDTLILLVLVVAGVAAMIAVIGKLTANDDAGGAAPTVPGSGNAASTSATAPRTAASPTPSFVSPFRPRPAQGRPALPGRPGGADDLIAIVGFNDRGCIILPPTAMSEPGVRRRVDELTSPHRFRGGATNLSAGMTQGLAFLEKSHNRIRRLVVVSDGEPNIAVDQLPGLAERARRERVSVCTIFCGDGNSPVLQSMADKTVGGWHTSVSRIEELAAAIRQASAGAMGGHRSGRRGIVVIAVDLSGSMGGWLGGGGATRIEGCRRAIHALLDHHASVYGVRVAA